jgi:hypothetical protein
MIIRMASTEERACKTAKHEVSCKSSPSRTKKSPAHCFVQGFAFLLKNWWTRRGSNPRPPHCERGALPAELLAHRGLTNEGYNLIHRIK